MTYEESLVFITSTDEDNTNFGTGFVIDQDGGYSYILTCAHVVRNAKGKEGNVIVNGVIAEVEAIGTPNGVDDLAVLRVEGQFGAPLSRSDIGNEGINFTSTGYQDARYSTAEGSVASGITMPLQGTLGKSNSQLIRGQRSPIKLWTLNIKDNDHFLPQPGYSGAPIVVNTEKGEQVIGVLSMQQGERQLAISIEVLDRVWPEQIHVPFTNREDELSIIISSSVPYYLLDAPAGYGKSTLLRELQKRFSKLGWSCAYLILNSPLELDELTEAVAEKLSISSLLPSSEIDQGAGYRLGVALRRHWVNAQEGIVLLFDLDTRLGNFEFLERLLKEFIPEIKDSLENFSPFWSGENRFRMIIAGRYLNLYYNAISVQKLYANLSPKYLTPFKYDVIQQSSILYLQKYKNHRVRQIADHILFLTGGHPGCMARVLQLYKETGMSPERFVERYSDKIWNDIVGPVVNLIIAEFPATFGVRKFMSNNVLRYMDYTALNKLVGTLELHEVRDESDFDYIDLADKLTGATLLSWNKYLLHDDITRRLICLGLRNDRREEFVQRCQNAQTICEERLRDNFTATPDMWAIEYLFQFLQQHALFISNPEQRQDLHSNFMSQELPKILQWLVTGRKVREQKSQLLRSIEEDWEFKFTVNYYLRHNEYDNEAVEELKSGVNRIL